MARRASARIPVGSIGGLPVELPLVSFGAGEPRVTFVCGLHGDEPSSLFLMDALMRELADDDAIVGTVQIVPFANPVAFATGSRVAHQDFLNMNALGRGSAGGWITERVLAALFDSVLRKSSLVIDCHEFSLRAPTIAVFPATGSEEVRATACRMLAAFEPELAWVPLLEGDSDAKYTAILSLALLEEGIPSVMLELPRECQNDSELVARTTRSFLNVLTAAGARRGELRSVSGEPGTRAVVRRLYTSAEAGLVYPEPSLRLMGEVEEGERLAVLVPFEDWSPRPVTADGSGLLMEAPRPSVVHTGSNLYSLGHARSRETALIHEQWRTLFGATVGTG